MFHRLSLFVIFTTAILAGCNRDGDAPSGSSLVTAQPYDSPYPFSEVIGNPTYPFEMKPKEQKDLFDKLKTLRPGQSYESVLKLLGPPYIQTVISAKEHPKPLGISVIYYTRKRDDLVNEKIDRYIDLTFGIDLHLTSIGTNVAELKFDAFTDQVAPGTPPDSPKLHLWTGGP